MNAYRSHTCGQLTAQDAGNEIRLSGWVHRVRDHGGVLFIDLRDHYGITQLVLHPSTPGFEIVERHITPDELPSFTECFITGTAAEVTPVSEIGEWRFTPGQISKALMDDYTAEVKPRAKAAA